VISWFEDSVSVTVAKAIKTYGAERVFAALGLDVWADIKPEGRQ
jgi:hypothetical protein